MGRRRERRPPPTAVTQLNQRAQIFGGSVSALLDSTTSWRADDEQSEQTLSEPGKRAH